MNRVGRKIGMNQGFRGTNGHAMTTDDAVRHIPQFDRCTGFGLGENLRRTYPCASAATDTGAVFDMKRVIHDGNDLKDLLENWNG